MWSNKTCEGCSHAGQCHSIYYRLGHTEGPSVAVQVLIAFGIPIAVFIAALMVVGTTTGSGQPTLLSFILALALTAVVVLGVWRLTRRPTDRGGRADKEQK